MVDRAVSLVSLVSLGILIAALLSGRPPPRVHADPVSLRSGVPATLYYQDPPGTPPGERPGLDGPLPGGASAAAVVVAHGFAADRNTMAALAESLAGAGYTVVSVDLSGHGLNRRPLASGWRMFEWLSRDIGAGVDFLTRTVGFEPAKITILGHSLGARAALHYASRTRAVNGLVLLGGSVNRLGPQRPPNALFLYAETDLPGIDRGVALTASRLAGLDAVQEDRTYGDVTAGTAVRVSRIPGVNHGGLVTSPVAFSQVIAWLDQATGFPARNASPAFTAHPLGSPLSWIAFLLVLPGLGLLLGRLAPEPAETRPAGRWPDFAALVGALLLPVPFLAAGRPGVLAGLSLADGNVTHFTVAGLVLLLGLLLAGRLKVPSSGVVAGLGLAVGGWVIVSLLFAPVGAYFHSTGLTPEKALVTVWAAACLAPLSLAMQWLLYRPSWWRGTLLRLAARAAVLGSIASGIALGVFGADIIAVVAPLAALVTVEPVLAGFYGRSRNIAAAAGFDALVTGWLFAVLLPITG